MHLFFIIAIRENQLQPGGRHHPATRPTLSRTRHTWHNHPPADTHTGQAQATKQHASAWHQCWIISNIARHWNLRKKEVTKENLQCMFWRQVFEANVGVFFFSLYFYNYNYKKMKWANFLTLSMCMRAVWARARHLVNKRGISPGPPWRNHPSDSKLRYRLLISKKEIQ